MYAISLWWKEWYENRTLVHQLRGTTPPKTVSTGFPELRKYTTHLSDLCVETVTLLAITRHLTTGVVIDGTLQDKMMRPYMHHLYSSL